MNNIEYVIYNRQTHFNWDGSRTTLICVVNNKKLAEDICEWLQDNVKPPIYTDGDGPTYNYYYHTYVKPKEPFRPANLNEFINRIDDLDISDS